MKEDRLTDYEYICIRKFLKKDCLKIHGLMWFFRFFGVYPFVLFALTSHKGPIAFTFQVLFCAGWMILFSFIVPSFLKQDDKMKLLKAMNIRSVYVWHAIILNASYLEQSYFSKNKIECMNDGNKLSISANFDCRKNVIGKKCVIISTDNKKTINSAYRV